ncbi:glycosyltransferase family 39 protein [bacterium]|nr:glycosyltransferase family 39 protein [bacterium]
MKKLQCWLSKDLVFSALIAAVMFLAFLPFLGKYYPDGDELEIIMRGKHLSWGYVNEPLVPYASRFWGEIFGYHMESERLIPLACCSLAVFLTGLLTKLMGGKAPAQALASLCLALAPIFTIAAVRLDVLGFDFLLWSAIFCLMAHIFNTDKPKLWLYVGVLCGVALINKLAASLLMEAILLGICLTSWKRHLRTPWPYLGALIAVLFIVPTVYWWSQHDWSGIEFLRSLYSGDKYRMSVGGYMLGQMLYMNLLCVPVWLAGLFALLFWRPLLRYRLFAYVWLMLLVIFLQNNSGIHYLSAAYPVLLASGAIFLLDWTHKCAHGLALRRVYAVLLALCTMFLPLIVVRGIKFGTGNWHEEFLKAALSVSTDRGLAGKCLGLLASTDDIRAIFKGCPDNIVYNYSFEEQVKIVAREYYSRPYVMRRVTLIYSDMEASAAALDYYGPDYCLPGYACCRFTNYYWGLPENIRYVHVLAASANYDMFLNDYFTYGGECGDNVRWWLGGRIDIRDIWAYLRRSIRE